jgi:hypothetical protein
MDVTLQGNEAGLVGLFSFNQGIAGGDNSNLITALDNTANSNHGTLSGFALTGATSNFAAHASTVLPVRLSGFTVQKQGAAALLQWQTSQEQNSRLFAIEKSTDGAGYAVIGSVDAAGSSSAARNYSFTDPTPQSGMNYYRLKQLDADGHFTYSPVRVLDFAAPRRLTWSLAGDNAVQLRLAQGLDEPFTVTDMSGHNAAKGQLSGGNARLSLKPGVYVVRVMTRLGELRVQVVVPQ